MEILHFVLILVIILVLIKLFVNMKENFIYDTAVKYQLYSGSLLVKFSNTGRGTGFTMAPSPNYITTFSSFIFSDDGCILGIPTENAPSQMLCAPSLTSRVEVCNPTSGQHHPLFYDAKTKKIVTRFEEKTYYLILMEFKWTDDEKKASEFTLKKL